MTQVALRATARALASRRLEIGVRQLEANRERVAGAIMPIIPAALGFRPLTGGLVVNMPLPLRR
ncbi:hypothetical protein FHS82_004034 [Pseudochelatococcus lubricantis]|uniref:Uncharacterized protein n=1 Tax=Pseudochelatococcus lubricantis TaxID=1538102 RepID=A0ABX0V4M3_9HYPH|nr:hypothetical protein [Pseudochelatococcus lubricantis]NIJ60167.1 hypothetical protein [Pseudochelatococcus lubricantis]